MLFPILLLPVHSDQVIMSSVTTKGPAKFEQQLPSGVEVFTPESSIIYARSGIETNAGAADYCLQPIALQYC
jgi:hypothetical protein